MNENEFFINKDRANLEKHYFKVQRAAPQENSIEFTKQ